MKLDLQILESRSLKEKRMVLRRIKDRVRARLGLVIAEVGDHELWQRAQLGVAAVSGDRGKVVELLDAVCRCAAGVEGVEFLAQWREVSSFAGELGHDAGAIAAFDGAAGGADEGDVEGRIDGDVEGCIDGDLEGDYQGDLAGEIAGGGGGEPGARARLQRGAGGRAGRGERAHHDAEWLPPEWQRMLDEESR